MSPQLDNLEIGQSYLRENTNTVFPLMGVPELTNPAAPEDDSEIRSLVDLKISGAPLTYNEYGQWIHPHLTLFGLSQGVEAPADLLDPSTSTETDIANLVANNTVVRLKLNSLDNSSHIDTDEVENYSGQTNLRKEEVYRGGYIHGYCVKGSLFLSYVIDYKLFYDYYSSGGYYGLVTSDYTSDPTTYPIVPKTVNVEAPKVQSLIPVSWEDSYSIGYDEFPDVGSGDYNTAYESYSDDEFIAEDELTFCRTDQAGTSGGGGNYPSYITGPVLCPTRAYPIVISSSEDIDVPILYGDIFFQEGYNVVLDDASRGGGILFSVVAGEGSGFGPECDLDGDEVLRYLNSTGPDRGGGVSLLGQGCITVGLDNSQPSAGGYASPLPSQLHISGFCAECCPCPNYENTYKALINIAQPLVQTNCETCGEDCNYVCRALSIRDDVHAIQDQYATYAECQEEIKTTVVGWGHYGYLVSFQGLIRNNYPVGSEPVGGDDLTLKFIFEDEVEVDYVEGTAFANFDARGDVDTNPTQPLDKIGDPDLNIVTNEENWISVNLALLPEDGGHVCSIHSGRYVMVGGLAYLRSSVEADPPVCDSDAPEKVISLNSTFSDDNPEASGVGSDSNTYSCLGSLFVDTPCTPPTPSYVAYDRDSDTLSVRVAFPEARWGNDYPTTISAKLRMILYLQDYVPRLEGDDTLDWCENLITYDTGNSELSDWVGGPWTAGGGLDFPDIAVLDEVSLTLSRAGGGGDDSGGSEPDALYEADSVDYPLNEILTDLPSINVGPTWDEDGEYYPYYVTSATFEVEPNAGQMFSCPNCDTCSVELSHLPVSGYIINSHGLPGITYDCTEEEPLGSCCVGGLCLPDQSQASCDVLGGVWVDGGECESGDPC